MEVQKFILFYFYLFIIFLRDYGPNFPSYMCVWFPLAFMKTVDMPFKAEFNLVYGFDSLCLPLMFKILRLFGYNT